MYCIIKSIKLSNRIIVRVCENGNRLSIRGMSEVSGNIAGHDRRT